MKVALTLIASFLFAHASFAAQEVESVHLVEYYVFGTNPDDPGETVQNLAVASKVELKNRDIQVEFKFDAGDTRFQQYATRLKDVRKLVARIDDLGQDNIDDYTYMGTGVAEATLVDSKGQRQRVRLECQQSQYSGRQQVSCYFPNRFDNIYFVFKR